MRTYMRVCALLLVLSIPFLPTAAGKGDVAKGKETYKRCAACHGDSGEGKDAIAKMFGVTMRSLSSKEVQALDDAALKKIILDGKGKMMPLGLSDAEAEDVLAFLRSLKK